MSNPLACPRCTYVRQSTDTASVYQCPSCRVVFSQLSKTPESGHAAKTANRVRVAIGAAAGAFVSIATMIGVVLLSKDSLSQGFGEIALVMLTLFGAYHPKLLIPVLLIFGTSIIALACALGLMVYWKISGPTGTESRHRDADSKPFGANK